MFMYQYMFSFAYVNVGGGSFQVQQMHLVAPLDKHFSLLYTLLKEHIADDVDYKVGLLILNQLW